MTRIANPPMPVTPLLLASHPKAKKTGRPSNLEQPPLPQEILNALSEVERQHFEFFVDAYSQAFTRKYGVRPTPTAQFNITQAALEYIHLLRLQCELLTSRTLISQARQHPGVQLRAWLQSAGLQERDLDMPVKPQENTAKDILLQMSKC